MMMKTSLGISTDPVVNRAIKWGGLGALALLLAGAFFLPNSDDTFDKVPIEKSATVEMPVAETSGSETPFSAPNVLMQDSSEEVPAKAELWKMLSEARHRIEEPTEREVNLPGNEGVHYFASNPSEQLTARFEAGAVRLQSGQNEEWSAKVAATSLRRGAEEVALPVTSAPMSSETEVRYRRGDVVEWWKNDTEGFEHGFTLTSRPLDGQGRLEIDVEMAGLVGQVSGDGVILTNQAGSEVMSYRGLRVWDAEGRELPSEMAVDGSTVSILIADAGAVYPVTVDPVFGTLEAQLRPDLLDCGKPDDLFGHDVDIRGDYALVGVPGDDNLAGNDAGAAYLFQRQSAGWEVLVKLKANDAAAGNRMGGAVAMGDGFALVGARLADVNGKQDAGAVYSFGQTMGMWMQFLKMRASDFSVNAWFGDSIDLDGDWVIIGASNANDGRGAAYIWQRRNTLWTQRSILKPASQSPQDGFGRSVALRSGTALIGAPGFNSQAGAAYLFSGSGTSWSETQILQAPAPAGMDAFGASVGLGTNCGLVGAPGRDTSAGVDAGAVFGFAPNGGPTWSPTQELVPGDAAGGDQFGAALDMFGKTALIGAPGNDGSVANEGSAYIFAPPTGNSLIECAQFWAPSAVGGEAFGNAVGLDGVSAIVGAYLTAGVGRQSETLVNRGAAYVFGLSSSSNSDIAVKPSDPTGDDEDSAEIQEQSSLDFGSITVCTTACQFFTIRNTGLSPLENLRATISGGNSGDFAIGEAPPSTLAPGAVFTLKLIFQPMTEGSKSSYLTIASSDSDESSIMISMFGVATAASMPVIATHPMSQYIPLGGGVRLTSTAVGDPTPDLQWFYNDGLISRQTKSSLVIIAKTLSSAGRYHMTATNKAGTASSDVAEIAVVDTKKRYLCLPCETSVTLTVDAAGNDLSFYWMKNGMPLGNGGMYNDSWPSDGRISVASDGRSVTIQMLQSDDTAIYSCRVYGPAGHIVGGCYDLTVLTEGPSLSSFSLPNARVPCAYSFAVPYASEPYRKPTSFSATGLPAGLSIDPATGVISGTPSEAGDRSYNVEITATNPKGYDTVMTSMYVYGLPCGSIGTFKGLVDRDGALNGGFGGAFDLTISPTGAFSGSLRMAEEFLPFAGVVNNCVAPYDHLTGRVVIRRQKPFRNLVLNFSVDPLTGCANGTVTDNVDRPWMFETFAGSAQSAGHQDGAGANSLFDCPCGIAVDKVGNFYVADTNNHVIRRVSPTGQVITFAGAVGVPGNSDGCDPDSRFNSPKGITVCPDGFIYVADAGNQSIRKVSPEGKVTTLAGGSNPTMMYWPGDSQSSSMPPFSNPMAITCGSDGCLYVADAGYHAVMKVTPTGEVSVLAGTPGTPGSGDGAGSGASFYYPTGIAYYQNGGNPLLYVADRNNHTIRRIEISSATVTTHAGAAWRPGSTDGRLENARFNSPLGIVADTRGNVFVTEGSGGAIRRIDACGLVTTLTRPCPGYFQPGWIGCNSVERGIDPRIGRVCRCLDGQSSIFSQPGGIVWYRNLIHVTDCGSHTITSGRLAPFCEVAVLAKRNPWGADSYSQDKTQSQSCFSPPATSYAGNYKFVLEPCSAIQGQSSLYPQGNGIGSVTVNSDGTVSVSCKLADGSLVTLGTCLGGRYFDSVNCFPLFAMLYGDTGSVMGWVNISLLQGLSLPAPPPTMSYACQGNWMDGCLDWVKVAPAGSERNYGYGIPLHQQSVIGEQASSSSASDIVSMFFQNSPQNAFLEFNQGGLSPGFSQTFDLDPNGAATFPVGGPDNLYYVTMTYSPSTCEFGGGFNNPFAVSESTGTVPAATGWSNHARLLRQLYTPQFEGVFLCRLGYGAGFFLLGQEDSAGNVTLSTPLLSGQVTFMPTQMMNQPAPEIVVAPEVPAISQPLGPILSGPLQSGGMMGGIGAMGGVPSLQLDSSQTLSGGSVDPAFQLNARVGGEPAPLLQPASGLRYGPEPQ